MPSDFFENQNVTAMVAMEIKYLQIRLKYHSF